MFGWKASILVKIYVFGKRLIYVYRKYAYPITTLFSVSCVAPSETSMKAGGYHCNSYCINGNTPIGTLQEAWTKCGEISSCTRIMKYSNNKFYLRKADDEFDSDSSLKNIAYKCTSMSIFSYAHLFFSWNYDTIGLNPLLSLIKSRPFFSYQHHFPTVREMIWNSLSEVFKFHSP